jgi:Mn-dependent DtxR family transcriptional regulator
LKGFESTENYLETILILSLKDKKVRSIDIAKELEYSKPSVSIAMKNLKAKNYIVVDDNGSIMLTDVGRKIAKTVYERHVIFSNWLISLGVDETTALEDACKMEHAISEKSFFAIKKNLSNQVKDKKKK